MDEARATMRVSDLAGAVGVSPDTVRYYERLGLLRAPSRSTANYRRYDVTAVDRLRFIQGAKRLGLRLAEIRGLLELRDSGECPCDAAATVLHTRLAGIEAEIEKLSRFRTELAAFVARIPEDCPEPEPGTWRPRREVTV